MRSLVGAILVFALITFTSSALAQPVLKAPATSLVGIWEGTLEVVADASAFDGEFVMTDILVRLTIFEQEGNMFYGMMATPGSQSTELLSATEVFGIIMGKKFKATRSQTVNTLIIGKVLDEDTVRVEIYISSFGGRALCGPCAAAGILTRL